jgi:hypothetical protein
MCILLLAGAAVAQSKPAAKTVPKPPEPAPEQFQIAGRVVNATSGAPLAGAEVGIGVAGKPEIIDGVLTDDDGRFIFRNLAAGKYWLAAEHSPQFPRQPYGQREQFFIAIAVGPKILSADVEFRLRPGSSIEGTVTDEQGDGARNAKVMLFHSVLVGGARQTQFLNELQTDDQGHYLFSHLLPGSYYVAVQADPWYATGQPAVIHGPLHRARSSRGGQMTVQEETLSLPPRPEARSPLDVVYPITYFANAADPVSATFIDVKGSDRATADLVLMPAPAIHLKLRCGGDCEATPAAAAAFQPVFAGHTVVVGRGTAVVTAEGQTAAGEIDISVPPAPALFLGGAGELAITPADGAEIDLRTATPDAHIRGQVAMDDGSALKDGSLLLVGTNARITLPVKDGKVEGRTYINFAGAGDPSKESAGGPLQPGLYNFLPVALDGAQVKSLTATGAKVNGTSIEVEPGAKVNFEIVLTKGTVDLTGTAVRDGKPMAGAMVLLVPDDIEHNEALIRRDESDSDGTFLLRATLPGKYTLLAIDEGWDLEWKRPEVLAPYLKAGQTAVVKAGSKSELKVTVQQRESVELIRLGEPETQHPKP